MTPMIPFEAAQGNTPKPAKAPKSKIYLDFETASEVDLRKCGVDVYSKHPSTRVICFAYAINNGPVEVWTPTGIPPLSLSHVLLHIAGGGEVIAHNSTFERAIWNNVLAFTGYHPKPMLQASQLTGDTMIRSLYWGLPGGLDQAALALGLPFGKDVSGHRTMMQLAKPRLTRPDGSCEWWHEVDGAKFKKLIEYCKQDVELERLLDRMLPDLPPTEQAFWLMDQRMNDRGLTIDTARIHRFRRSADRQTRLLDASMRAVTKGEVYSTRSMAALVKYCADRGIHLKSLAKDNIKNFLDENDDEELDWDIHEATDGNIQGLLEVTRALRLRQEAAKTSNAKLDRMLACADDTDLKVRHVFQFYGAGRTGRYAGRLIQPQNFPKPHLKRDKLEEEIQRMFDLGADLSLTLISSALRSCIIAEPGKLLVVVDFAQIEARVLAWLCGQLDILDAFDTGADIYTYAAAKIGSTDRQLGKVATLGLGYGMGAQKFKDTAKTYGLDLTLDTAQSTVDAWRASNKSIVSAWYDLERNIKHILGNPKMWGRFHHYSQHLKLGNFRDKRTDTYLFLIRLPSGRHLVYRQPEMTGHDITYMGVDQYTKQWDRINSYGAKFIENIVQGIARDLMVDVMQTSEKVHQVELVGTVHDEGIWTAPAAIAPLVLDTIVTFIKIGPPWAKGLPLGADGFISHRYGK